MTTGRIYDPGAQDWVDLTTDGPVYNVLVGDAGLFVITQPITHATPGLNAGVAFDYGPLPVGTLIYDAGFFIPTAFNGTTPIGEIGLYQLGNVNGLLGTFGASTWDLTNADNAAIQDGISAADSAMTMFAYAANNGNAAPPLRVNNAGPLYVVASQDGSKGGTALDSTAGAATAWALIGPAAFA